ncbi:MAG: hypothetical protein JWO22_527 [Frankiales bacterium]|nr:hypothetical protein [Frankiales bacterium]
MRRLWVAWAGSRLLSMALLLWGAEQPNLADVRTFRRWSFDLWEHGRLPHEWEYPIGAVVALVPGGGDARQYATYFAVLACLMLAVDAGVAALLRESRVAAWTWVVGLPLLGPVCWTRFDLVPAVLCVLALRSSGVRQGLAAAAGGLVKFWPLLVLPATRNRRAALTAIAVLVLVGTAVAITGGPLFSPLSNQGDRGLQVEAVPATAYAWGHALGMGTGVRYVHHAWEVTGSLESGVGLVTGLVALAVVAVLLVRGGEAAWLTCAVVAVVLVGDKVLSPQYLLWVLAPVCVGLARGSVRTGVLLPLGLALVATHVVYPLSYGQLLAGDALPTLLLSVRNVALLWLAVVLVRAPVAP